MTVKSKEDNTEINGNGTTTNKQAQKNQVQEEEEEQHSITEIPLQELEPYTKSKASSQEPINNLDNSNASNSTRQRRKKQFAVSTRWEHEYNERLKSSQENNECCTGTPEDLNSICCCCSHRIGGMFSILESSDGTPIIIAGPCWSFCVFITTPVILTASVLILYFIVFAGTTPWWLALLYIPMVVTTLCSLFFVSCRDPGLLERVTDEEAGESGWFWNEQVGSFRPAGAMYCRECKVLIQDYDHLCPWTGTGIGRGNIMAFRVFVVSVNLLCYFSIGIVAYFFLRGILQ